MLAVATRNALPPEERVVLELGEIEDEANVAAAMLEKGPHEPASLLAAREESDAADKNVNEKRTAVAAINATLLRLRSKLPWWRRAVDYFTGAEDRRQKEVGGTELKRLPAEKALAEAQARQSAAANNLIREQAQHREMVRAYIAKWTEIAKHAEERLVAVAKARELSAHLPGVVSMGPTALYQLGAKLSAKRRRSKSRDGEPELSVHFR